MLYYPGLVCLWLFSVGTLADDRFLRNVTGNIFGEELSILPLAFGDFNSDKLTDLIVLDYADRSKLSILLAKSQTFSLGPAKYFDPPSEAKKKSLLCYFNGKDVISAAPGEYRIQNDPHSIKKNYIHKLYSI